MAHEIVALAAEVAFSDGGQPRSGMGVDAADVFGSGYQDLFVRQCRSGDVLALSQQKTKLP